MDEADKRNLIPGQKYLVKFVQDNNFVVLECEFIKYYDNQYLDALIGYQRDFEMQMVTVPPAELV